MQYEVKIKTKKLRCETKHGNVLPPKVVVFHIDIRSSNVMSKMMQLSFCSIPMNLCLSIVIT